MANKQTAQEYTKEVTYTHHVTSKHKVSETVTVLIYEDQPEPLNEETAIALFAKYPRIKEIHELHEKWGGRWGRSITTRAHKSN